MDVNDYEAQVGRVRDLLLKHREHWYRMDRAGVASYRWAVKFTGGEIANPGVHKLAAIEDYLTSVAA